VLQGSGGGVYRAAQLEPQNEMISVYLSAALIELKQLDKALASAEHALEPVSHTAPSWTVRGTALAAMGRFQEALESVRRAIELGETSRSCSTNRPKSSSPRRGGAKALWLSTRRLTGFTSPEIPMPE